jgi:hypothetical protein
MGIIEIAGIIAALVGTVAGVAQVLDYLAMPRRLKRFWESASKFSRIIKKLTCRKMSTAAFRC